MDVFSFTISLIIVFFIAIHSWVKDKEKYANAERHRLEQIEHKKKMEEHIQKTYFEPYGLRYNFDTMESEPLDTISDDKS